MKSAPILIVDKQGLIGERLSLKLSKEFLVALVTKKVLEKDDPNKNLIYIPFSNKFPLIPDNKYSHILVISEGDEKLEFLSSIIEKAKDVNAELIFAQDIFSEDQNLKEVLRNYSTSKIVVYGDIFSKNVIYKYEGFKSTVNKFIYQASRFKKIQIIGDGLKNAYPVYIGDVVDSLIDLIFGINDRHSIFYIFPKHPPTELSLAHMFHKANPEINIDFVRSDPRKININVPPNGKYLLDEKYPIAKKIKSIDLEKGIKIEEEKASIRESKKFGRTFSLKGLWIIVFLILAPFIFTLFFSFLGLNTLYFAKKAIDVGNFESAKRSLNVSNVFFTLGKKTSNLLILEAKIVRIDKKLKRLSEDISMGEKVSHGMLEIFTAGNYFSKVLNGESQNPLEDFSKGQNSLKTAIISIEKLKAENKIPALFSQKLDNVSPLIRFASNTIDIAPNLFGFEGKKNYLVLFQNNMELRPSGGFIGSYGVLKMDVGKVVDFSIHDVYDADGQLKGHIEPPYAIRRYLPSAHWYLRDSNFDIDFVKSATTAANFLNVETSERVDGVIGVDVTFVKKILEAIGPIDVPDYSQKVDANNVYILTQTHSEKNFFPGSTQKKDFLRSLYRAILAKIKDNHSSYLLLLKAFSDSLEEKHLLFAFDDNKQKIFTVNGWSSSLFDERKNNKNIINDFAGINEANFGVNKVNYFIKRKISQSVKIEENGNLFEELDISYKNTSTSWPGGDYKNYLRLVFPLNTNISSISINDVNQEIIDAIVDFEIYEDKDFKPPKGLEVEKVIENGKTIYGFLVNVPVGELVRIRVQYNVARLENFDLNNFSYNLKLFKQPGVDSLPYSFSLYYPDNLNVIKASDGLERGDNELSYSENIVKDQELFVNLARK